MSGTVRQHPGLELLGAQTAVAGPYLSGHRLDRDVQVLARVAAVRPHADVGLLGLAHRLHNTSGIAQQGAEFRRCRVVELRNGHDVLSRTDDQGAEIHRTDGVVHHPSSGLMQDAPG
jgi:hypothetical protein